MDTSCTGAFLRHSACVPQLLAARRDYYYYYDS